MIDLRKSLLFLSALVSASMSAALGLRLPPSTDIYLARLRVEHGTVSVGPPVNITDRPGYDNQPSFTPDSKSILFTSVRADAQADIYRYDLTSRSTTQVT